MQPAPKTIAESRFTLSALMGPQDTNAQGNVHGGVIMKMADEAGALVAMRHSRMPVVTVAIDSMTFMEPIYLGNLVQCNGELTLVGTTSMEVRVEVIAENPMHGASKLTNIAYIVYVALDSKGRPAPVPPLTYESPAEQARAAEARARQDFRKRLRAQEKSAQ